MESSSPPSPPAPPSPSSNSFTSCASSAASAPTQVIEPSIYQVAQLHCRERLIVEPFHWTNRQIELLGFEFQEAVPAPPPDTELIPEEKQSWEHRHSVRRVCESTGFMYRPLSFSYLLAAEGPFQQLVCLPFNFHNQHITTLPGQVYFPAGDPIEAEDGKTPPIAAYVDSVELYRARRESLRGVRGKKTNTPGNNLFDIKLKKLTPSNPLRDPCIVALLIGIAQRQQHALEHQNIKPSTFLSSVYFTSEDDHEFMHLFSANIPLTLLNQLDDPSTPTVSWGSTAIPIRHLTIPFRPFNTFRDRVLLPLQIPDYIQQLRGANDFEKGTNRGRVFPTRKPLRKRKHGKRGE